MSIEWTIYSLRYRRHVLKENFWSWLARKLPVALRRAVIVNAAVAVREPRMRPGGGYCGPDGIEYKDLWEAAAK